MEVNKCPLCTQNLEFKQINLNTAIEICVNLECRYPVGMKCRVISRKLGNIYKASERSLKPKEFNNLETSSVLPEITPPQSDSFSQELDAFLTNIYDEKVQPDAIKTEAAVKEEMKNDNDTLSFNQLSSTDLDNLFNELNF